jgi:hypothetical protein
MSFILTALALPAELTTVLTRTGSSIMFAAHCRGRWVTVPREHDMAPPAEWFEKDAVKQGPPPAEYVPTDSEQLKLFS